MKNTLSRFAAAIVILALLAIGQAACGGGYSSPTAPSNAPGQPTPTPRAGGGY